MPSAETRSPTTVSSSTSTAGATASTVTPFYPTSTAGDTASTVASPATEGEKKNPLMKDH